MKRFCFNLFRLGLGFCFSVLLVSTSNAQTPANEPGLRDINSQVGFVPGADQLDNSVPTVPFDGGLSLILAASGISYATSKLKRKAS